ncbi:filamentous hemagglutinin N-terminal domain-containing protein, partial [Acidisphaera sp. S103]|uniref:beta strand repeat-containing protein n=1 Tax=Acidisphaera sp. S103 TaxID=1747223 RepID=UPI00131D4FF7
MAEIVRGCSRRGLLSSTALQAVAMVAVLAMAQRTARAQLSPNAHPMGGQVVAGQASITQTANTTTVTQTTARAAVDWQSYNVGRSQTVQYVDPSSSSVTLNRVVGPNPSQIAGRITSNGTVMIVNQAGLLFDGSAQINTAGLVVSAAGITNKNFMAGKMVFDQAANPGAKIENRGTITIKNQGLAALVAPQVVNSGVIRAKLGKVVLAGAEAETLDLYGDGMVSINVTKQVATAPDGRQALVTNTGAISASGGTVLLTAQAVDGVVQTLVDAGGKISANSAGGRTGRVVVTGAGGDVEVTGALTADGHAPSTTGGSVVVNTTGAVRLASTARVSASGPAGGGVVAIGTTLKRAKGGPSVTGQKTAKTVTVAAGATIAANATAKGNGGRLTVLSTDRTTIAGAVDTKGGPQGGDGGFVELSGGVLSLTGLVDASAPLGKTGALLIDPSDLYVSDAMPSSATPVLSPGSSVVVNSGTVSWVSPTELAALAANITLSAAHDLFFASGTTGANTLNLGGNTLTATAGNDLTIDRGFTINAGAISLTGSAGAITLGGTSGVDAGLIDAAQLGALGVTSLQGPSGSSVTMQAGTGIQLADAAIGSSAAPLSTLSLSTMGGGVTQAAGGVISAGTLISGGILAGSVALAGTANAIANIGSVAVTSGGFSLTDGISLNVGTLTAGTSATIQDTGTLLVSGMIAPSGAGPIDVSLTSGNLNLAGVVSDGGSGTTTLIANQGSIGQSGGNVLAGTLTGRAVTSASLTQPANLVGTLGVFTTGAGFALTDNEALSVTGPVTDTGASSTLALTTGTGNLTLAGNVSATNVLDLVSAGSIVQAGGSIRAAFLTGSAVASASLTRPTNLVGTLGAVSTGAGFALTDNEALLVDGAVSDTGAASTLALTTRTGNLTLAGTVSATNGLDLVSAGSIVQTGGLIDIGTLTGTAATSASLTQATNLVGTLGAFSTTAGFALTDNEALTVAGAVSDTGAASTLELITKTGGLTLAGNVSASNVLNLVSAGSISQSGGAISARTLTLTTTGAGNVDLTGPSNQIGASTGITVNAGSLSLVDERNLVLTGTQSANQLFFEVDAPGGGLQFGANTMGAALTATSGPISLVADTMTEGTAAST